MTKADDGAHPEVCETSVTVSAKAYSTETIKKAAYRLLDRAVVTVTPRGDDLHCTIRFSEPQNPNQARRIADELLAEIVDYDLRRIIADETANIRTAVLSYAFSRTGLQGDG